MSLNRGKYGISIDLKRREGIDLCLKLIEKDGRTDWLFRPGTLDRLGLGHNAVREIPRPRLLLDIGIWRGWAITQQAAMDLVVQCSSGLVNL
ncbi:MAG: CoA transferase [Acidobacteria bacterium]|nr:CoA transferase [Acidobacteriota bacterium]